MARLVDFAIARSSDKGDMCTLGVLAIEPEYYDILEEHLTEERVAEHLSERIDGEVERYPMPNISGFNFVLHHALDGGGQRSLRGDNLGKTLSGQLLRMELPVEKPPKS